MLIRGLAEVKVALPPLYAQSQPGCRSQVLFSMELTDAFVHLLPLQLLSHQQEEERRKSLPLLLLLITTLDASLLLCSVTATVMTEMSLSRLQDPKTLKGGSCAADGNPIEAQPAEFRNGGLDLVQTQIILSDTAGRCSESRRLVMFAASQLEKERCRFLQSLRCSIFKKKNQ